MTTGYADTNLFLALFAGPSHPLHRPALDLFRRVADGQLSLILAPIVLAELVYVSSAVLGWQRSEVAERLVALIHADGLIVRERSVLRRALELFGRYRRLDFADAYLVALGLVAGPPLVASFDRDFDGLEGVERLRA